LRAARRGHRRRWRPATSWSYTRPLRRYDREPTEVGKADRDRSLMGRDRLRSSRDPQGCGPMIGAVTAGWRSTNATAATTWPVRLHRAGRPPPILVWLRDRLGSVSRGALGETDSTVVLS